MDEWVCKYLTAEWRFNPSTPMSYAHQVTREIHYTYDPNFQKDDVGSAGQYGNLTQITEKSPAGESAVARRTTKRWYMPNTDDWLVGFVRTEAIYEGDGSGTPVAITYTEYDGQETYMYEPIRGLVTRISRAIPATCGDMGNPPGCMYARQLVDTTFDYNTFGNHTEVTTYTDFGYRAFDDNWVLLESADIEPTYARTTTTTFDTYNLFPTSVENPLDQTTSLTYGHPVRPDLVTRITDINNKATNYEYDNFGRLKRVIRPGNSSSSPTVEYNYFDDPGMPAEFLEPLLITARYYDNNSNDLVAGSRTFYDGLGRVVQTQTRQVDLASQTAGEKDLVVTREFNAQGQVACETAPFAVDYYDDFPNSSPYVLDACSAHPHTSTTYDDFGRPVAVIVPDDSQTTYEYKVFNNVVIVDDYTQVAMAKSFSQVTDNSGGSLTVERSQFTNAFGQLLMVRAYMGDYTQTYADTRYSYDVLGNLTHVGTSTASNPQPSSWLRESSMVFDGYSRKTSMVDEDMGDWAYDYDAAGNLRNQVDARGRKLCFYYDDLDRLTTKVEDSSPGNACPGTPPASGIYHLATYVYDSATNGAGQIASVSWGPDPADNYDIFTYESLRGRPDNQTRTIDGESYTMSTETYDLADRPVTIEYPDGEQVTTTFNAQGQPDSLAGTDTYVESSTYIALGLPKAQELGNGLTTWYGYHGFQPFNLNDAFDSTTIDADDFGRLWRSCTVPDSSNICQASQSQSSGDQVSDLRTPEYDDVGNILVLIDYTRSETKLFEYDPLSRLTRMEFYGGGGYRTYAYDEIGNITSLGGQSYSYGGTGYNHLQRQAVTSVGSSYTFDYDENGNMTDRTDGSGSFTQVFDAENRLVEVTNTASQETTSFGYDAAGIRLLTVQPNGTVVHTPFPNYEVEGPGSEWEVTRSYYSASGNPVALREQGNMDENFEDGDADGWTVEAGTWSFQGACKGCANVYSQTDDTAANASSSRPVDQVILNPPYIYKWTADFVSGSTRAGFYFFASDEDGTHHGNGYLVDQTANYMRIYEVANNTLTLRKQISKPASNGNSYDYQAAYDPTTGWIYIWRDEVYLTGWQDSTPYTSGSYVALRTHNSNVKFDNIQFDWSWLTYIHHDHLGSNSVMTDETGQVVQEARYYPYGDWRVEPTDELTDVGFTGHKHNNFSGSNDLGLIYMRARYYLPGVGRFASADTIVPDPQNPKQFNRYTYSLNNPIKFFDPTGHCGADPAGSTNFEGNDLTGLCIELRDFLEGLYDIGIEGIWTFHEMSLLELAIVDMVYGFGGDANFRSVFAGTNVVRYREAGISKVFWPLNEVQIRNNQFNSGDDFARWIFIHEFGHRLDILVGLGASSLLESETGGKTEGFGCSLPGVDLSDHCNYQISGFPVSEYSIRSNRREDWADSFAAAMFRGSWASVVSSGGHGIKSDALTVSINRIDLVERFIQSLFTPISPLPDYHKYPIPIGY